MRSSGSAGNSRSPLCAPSGGPAPDSLDDNAGKVGKRYFVERIGTAGWSIPASSRTVFPDSGTLLERYASRFSCVEINSSFYRPHRSSTYARWAAHVPASFAFALKMPKEITHTRRCMKCDTEIASFIDQTSALGSKRGVLLVQLPPSFAYDGMVMEQFFTSLRGRYDGSVVCEPRHRSWFSAQADATLQAFRIGRVAADPAICAAAAIPGGWPGIVYYRQHGSPRTYYSRYEPAAILTLAARLAQCRDAQRWCIFDNTAAGAAVGNALELQQIISEPRAAGGVVTTTETGPKAGRALA